MNNIKNNNPGASEVVCSTGVDKPELKPPRSDPYLQPGQLSEHEHEWPQETVPYPIARAMEFCFENCRIAQCSKESTGSADLNQQKCRFPQHCSIVFRGNK